MNRSLFFAGVGLALLLLPCLALAQSPPSTAGKPAAESKSAAQNNPAPQSKNEQKPAAASQGAGAFYADFDRDGDMDILLVEQGLLLSGGADGRFEAVRLLPVNGIGAALAPADETLRAQLKLAKDQGLVVTSVTPDSLAAKAGLQTDDILLAAGDRPLAKASDVSDIVNSPVKKPFTVEFTVLRGGERRNVPLKFEELVTDNFRVEVMLEPQPSYRVGVEVSHASSALRTQLKLPKDEGIVIDRVLPDSPALKAGLQNHDVLRAANGKPLKKSEDLSEAVRSSEGKPLKFAMVRAGQPLEITVTPEKRAGDYDYRTNLNVELLRIHERSVRSRGAMALLAEATKPHPQPTADSSAAQIERMLKQIDELRASVKALQGTVAKEQKPPPKSSVPSTDLPKAETPKK